MKLDRKQGWDIFDFFPAYVEQIWTNFIDVFYQVLCFSNWSEDQDGCPGLWLADTFFRLLCNRWTNETWQEERFQHSLISLRFWGHSESKDVCQGLRLAETFVQLLLCNCWTEFQLNLTGGKSSTSSTKFVISRLIIMKARHIIQYRASASLWRRGGGLQNKQEHQIILTKYEAVHPTAVSENYSVCIPFIICWYSGARMWLFWFSGNCSTFATNLQLIFWRSVSFGICFSHSDNFFMSTWLFETN